MRGKLLFALLGVLLGGAAVVALRPAGAPPDTALRPSAAERQLEQVIAEVDLESATLEQAVDSLRRQTGADIEVPWDTLDDLGFDRSATVVSLRARDLTLADALSRVLYTAGPRGTWFPLGYAVRGDVIVVGVEADLASHMEVRCYDVRDLLASRRPLFAESEVAAAFRITPPPTAEESRAAELVQSVRHYIDRRSWFTGWGGPNQRPSAVMCFDGNLVVTHTWQVHRAVRDLLREMRRPEYVAADDGAAGPGQLQPVREVIASGRAWVPLAESSEAEVALARRIPELSLENVPLEAAFETLRESTGANIRVDWPALSAAGCNGATPVNVSLRDVTLDQAISALVTAPSRLRPNIADRFCTVGYTVDGNVIVVSTYERLRTMFPTRVYDVRDLLPATADAGGGNDAARGRAVAELLHAVRRCIGRSQRDEVAYGRHAVDEWRGRLIVTHSAANHRRVEQLLADLRAADRAAAALDPRRQTQPTANP